MAEDAEANGIPEDEIRTVNQAVEAVSAGIRPTVKAILKRTDPDDWKKVVDAIQEQLLEVLDGQLSLNAQVSLEAQLNAEDPYIGTTQVKASLLKLFESPSRREFLLTLPGMRLVLLDLIAADPEGIRGDLLRARFRSRMRLINPTINYTDDHINVLIMRLRKVLETVNMKIERRGQKPARYRLVVHD